MKSEKKVLICIFILIFLAFLVLVGFGVYKFKNSEDTKQTEKKDKQPKEYKDTDYNIKLIKTVNSTQEDNYLISPYSIEIALNMLRDGANGESKEQIDKVIGTRDIPVFDVKERISVTNGAFIKNEVKDLVNDSYYEKLKEYKAELVYDEFMTPDKINEWVKEKTWGMIPHLLDDISKDFVMGIANAVAIDVEWADEFECVNTRSEKFTKEDGSTMNTEMMHANYEHGYTKYFEMDGAKGIIIPYRGYDKNGKDEYNSDESEFTKLEFVGFLPDGSVNDFIEGLSQEKLDGFDKTVTTTNDAEINLSLPRFSYSFDYKGFASGLEAMGIEDVFNAKKADLTNIFSRENIEKMNADNVYVSKAVHKTYIDLNEKGTKAAAVTYFGMDKASSVAPTKKKVKIEFNKPFVYMIRDSKTKEILFFGVVRKPNEWKGSTCSNKD